MPCSWVCFYFLFPKTYDFGCTLLLPFVLTCWGVGVPTLNLLLICSTLLIANHLWFHLDKWIPEMVLALKREDLVVMDFTGIYLNKR